MEKVLVRKRTKTTWQDYKKHKALFIMVLPLILYFLIFHYGPIYGLMIAFKDYYPTKGVWASEWVGLEHFRTMFQGIFFIPVLMNTLINSFYNLVFGFPAPIILAILLNEVSSRRFKKVIQTVTYFPHFISWVVLAGIVYEMLSPRKTAIKQAMHPISA